jgi:MscS family membrane protein
MKFLPALLVALSLFAQLSSKPDPSPQPDPLGRDNPRASVTRFLQACQRGDFAQASQYLDLSSMPRAARAERGPQLARQLDAALNADPHFSVLQLSRDAQGDLADDADAGREHIATARENGKAVSLDMQRVQPSPGAPAVWLFSGDTVLDIPRLATGGAASGIERHLPPFLSRIAILQTPLWKWIALLLGTLLLVAVSRQFDRLIAVVVRAVTARVHAGNQVEWVRALLAPVRVSLCLLIFRLGLELIGPSALARLYVGRLSQALFVWSIAWCVMRLVELFMTRAESRMDATRRFASRSVLRLGRRTINTTVAIVAILLVLSNWGYNTATLVAGLGVGGIAIALAAQQTLANVFGGVSVIADHPIRIGEYGKFGDLLGTLEDIGLRSTRIRTLNRTIVSVPNATFAGYNLENYASRDKFLFNPTLSVKRGATEEAVRGLIKHLHELLAANKQLELVPTPVRLISLSGGAVNLEIFCYVLTADIDLFYSLQGDLYIVINQALTAAGVELA